MAEAIRMKGKILFTNLTRNVAEGESPETEFIYVILESLDSLRSQVYIHKNDIIDGAHEDYKDGVEVIFTPEKVTDEKFNAAIAAGKPIRRYQGKMVVLASANATVFPQPIVAEVADKKVDTASANQPKPEQKPEYTLELKANGPTWVTIIGKLNNKPAPLTYIIGAQGNGAESARFKILGSEDKELYTIGKSFSSEDGNADVEMQYERGSLSLVVRCIEGGITKHLKIWK